MSDTKINKNIKIDGIDRNLYDLYRMPILIALGVVNKNTKFYAGTFRKILFDKITIFRDDYASRQNNGIKILKTGYYRVSYCVRLNDNTNVETKSVSAGFMFNDNPVDFVNINTWSELVHRITISASPISGIDANKVLYPMVYVEGEQTVEHYYSQNAYYFIEYITDFN